MRLRPSERCYVAIIRGDMAMSTPSYTSQLYGTDQLSGGRSYNTGSVSYSMLRLMSRLVSPSPLEITPPLVQPASATGFMRPRESPAVFPVGLIKWQGESAEGQRRERRTDASKCAE